MVGRDPTSARSASIEGADYGAPSGAIFVNVLGPVEAFDEHRTPLACGARRERQLLALLALHDGQSLSEGAIIDALWGETPPRSAVKTTHSYVFRLRRSLGHNVIERTGNGYQIAIAGGCLDVARVALLAAAAEEHRLAGRRDDAKAGLEAALAYFRGDLELPDTLAGDALRRRVIEMHDELLDAYHQCRLEMGEGAAIVASLESAVAASPLDERRWGQLMLALYRSGRQADALQVYQRARRELVDHVGLEPGPELRRLEQRIIDQDPTLVATPVAAVDLAHHESTSAVDPAALSDLSWMPAEAEFVGRRTEMTTARQLWDQVVVNGQRRLLLIDGEAGIGKTTFAGALARQVAAGDGIVLHAQCSPSDGGYQPFTDLLSRYLRVAPLGTVEHQVEDLRGDLALLLPSLVTGSEKAPSPDPDSDQSRMFAAVSRFIDTIADVAPLLLVVDDWHWAPQPTLRLVHYLMRSHTERPILVVGTYRRTDMASGSPLRGLLGELHRTERVSTIALAGLDTQAVAEIIERAAGHTLDHHLVAADALQSVTGGNPFFVHEVIVHLTESGEFIRRDGRWQTSDLTMVALPGSVREVIGLRLGRLTPETVAMLRVAAVAGPAFDVALVACVQRTSIDAVVDAAEEATAVGLLLETERPGRFAFEHDLVRQTVLADISTTRQVRTHWSIAETLARLGDGGINELAHHAHEGLLAGNPRQAAEWMRAAALETLHRTAADTALLHTDNALAAIDDVEGCDDLRADLLSDRAIALLESGAEINGQPFTMACEAAESAAIDRGDPARIVRAVTLDDRLTASGLVGLFDDRRVTSALRALAVLPSDDPISRAHVLSQIVDGYAHYEDQATAEAFTREALDNIEGAPVEDRDRVLARLALAAGCNPSRHQIVPALAEELLAGGSLPGIGAAIQATSFVRAYAGEFAKTEATGQRLLESGEQTGSRGMQILGSIFLTGAASARGDVDALQRIVDRDLPQVNARYARMRYAVKLHATIALADWTGDDHGGLALALPWANEPPPAAAFFAHGARIIAAWTAMNTGDDARSLEIWNEVRHLPVVDACHGLLTTVSAACATDLVVRYGTASEAEPIRGALEAHCHLWVTNGPIALGPVVWYASRLSTVLGDETRAAEERRHALEFCDRAGLGAWGDRIRNTTTAISRS